MKLCLLTIHHTSEQIVKLAKIRLVWRDLDNVSSVPKSEVKEQILSGGLVPNSESQATVFSVSFGENRR